ncbi:MAG: polysaccharide biosynthesis/export family protein [Prevotella sp.]|nr:polysaccharide biosynthesis/export family protein [Prevotella sp.]
MKKILSFVVLAAMTMAFTSCVMTKQVAYFQNLDSVNLAGLKDMPQIRIKPNDELTIIVSSLDPDAARPFNMSLTATANAYNNSTASKTLYSYIVDSEGNVNFPVVGKLKLEGMTRPEAETFIAQSIKPYFADGETPIVKVRYSSFKVTVIGEVSGSRVLSVENERLSIIEALAQCGDLSVYGKRPNILLIRESADGEKMTARFNLNDANILNSPYYYLQQNDIIYVEPHKARARSADVSSYTFWTPISSVLISLATLTISLTK